MKERKQKKKELEKIEISEGPKKFWVEKNFGSKKNFWSEKNLGLKKILFRKIFWEKKIWV